MPTMRVLLVSPWRMDGLVCGDDIITDLLMSHPPAGVTYRHFGQALAEGWLRRTHPARAWLASLVMHSRPPAGVRYDWPGLPPLPYRLLGKLLPDRPDLDVQWLGLQDPGAVDLVHAYTFPVHLDSDLPLVLGNSSGNTDLLLHYYGLTRAQATPLIERDRRLLSRLKIDHDLYHADRARLITLPSRYAMRLHEEAGVPAEKLRLVRIGLPTPDLPERTAGEGLCRFTLVGQGFERKGGPALLAAFRRLYRERPDTRLTIVSQVALAAEPGVEHYPSLPREDVLGRIYPATDVYVLPTRAEGYGLSVVEAMSYGLPVIASNIAALPELVTDNGLLLPPADEEALYQAMRTLAEDPALRARMGKASRAAFLAEHSTDVTRPLLAAVYAEAAGTRPS